MFRSSCERAARLHAADQLGKLESEVTDEDLAEINRQQWHEVLRRTKWNFAIGCGGVIILAIVCMIVF